MQAPVLPNDEPHRLLALRSLRILDSLPEERFDRVTRLAQRLFDVEIAVVSLVDEDRQWFKSRQGLAVTETSRDVSFCGHAILGENILVVLDALRDARFHDNPLVADHPFIRFYAGCPISGPSGHKLGTLCVIDSEPRDFSEDDHAHLRDLARLVEDELIMQDLAITDPLSGLCNRRGFETVASNTLAVCRRLGYPATLAYFDLDGLKAVNDAHGHDAGDRLLEEFSLVLSDAFRSSDVIARLGGDEFCALLSGASSAQVQTPMSRLQASVAARQAGHPDLPALRYSVGLTAFDPRSHAGVHDLVRDADARMYEMKRARRAAEGAAGPDDDLAA